MVKKLERSAVLKFKNVDYKKIYFFNTQCCIPISDYYYSRPLYACNLFYLVAKIHKNSSVGYLYGKKSHLRHNYQSEMLNPIERYKHFIKQIRIGYMCKQCLFISIRLYDVKYLHLEKKALKYFKCTYCIEHFKSVTELNSHIHFCLLGRQLFMN